MVFFSTYLEQDEESTRAERRSSLNGEASSTRSPDRPTATEGEVKEKVSSDPSCAGEEEEGTIQTVNMFVRTRTDSGKPLTDREILEQVTVLNLDTGEQIPLSIAEDKLPQCLNPLSLHIMRLTSEYIRYSCTRFLFCVFTLQFVLFAQQFKFGERQRIRH